MNEIPSKSAFDPRVLGHIAPFIGLIASLAAAATAMAADDPAPAPPPPTSPPVALKGSFRLRAEGNGKTDLANVRDFMLMRIRPEVTFTPSAEASVFFQPQFAKTWGETAFPGSSASANTRTETSGSTYDTGYSVHQAFVDYHPNPGLKLIAGRQVLSYGNELVIGALDWNNTGRSFDAARARASVGQAGWSDLFFSKLVDQGAASPFGGDRDLYGLYNSFDLGEGLRSVDLYALYLQDATAANAAPSRLGTLGLRAQSVFGAADYRVELTHQGGVTRGYQADAEWGYTFVDAATRPRFGIEGFVASEDYNQLYPTVHKWLGYADVFGRRNLLGGALHASADVTQSVRVQLDHHLFRRKSASAPAYKLNGTTALGSTAGSGSKDLAQETDLTLQYKAASSVTFTGGGSYVFSGAYLRDQFGGVAPTFYYVQMDVKF